MTHLDLSVEQTDLLHEILKEYLGDLRMELASTENFEFRDKLKKQEMTVKQLLALVSPIGTSA